LTLTGTWLIDSPADPVISFKKENAMLRIKRTTRPKKAMAKDRVEDRMAIIDCGRAREQTKGLGGNSLESGFPPFNHHFPVT
jgi:hypothetical protein